MLVGELLYNALNLCERALRFCYISGALREFQKLVKSIAYKMRVSKRLAIVDSPRLARLSLLN